MGAGVAAVGVVVVAGTCRPRVGGIVLLIFETRMGAEVAGAGVVVADTCRSGLGGIVLLAEAWMGGGVVGAGGVVAGRVVIVVVAAASREADREVGVVVCLAAVCLAGVVVGAAALVAVLAAVRLADCVVCAVGVVAVGAEGATAVSPSVGSFRQTFRVRLLYRSPRRCPPFTKAFSLRP